MAKEIICPCGQTFFDFGDQGVYCSDCVDKLNQLKDALQTEGYMGSEV